MNEEEAIERLKYIDMQYDCNNYYSRYDLDCIETVLNLLEKKDIDIIEAKEANRQLSVELQKKDKIIDEIEDLCIRKGDDEGEEYGGVIIWNFARKIMDIIRKESRKWKLK